MNIFLRLIKSSAIVVVNCKYIDSVKNTVINNSSYLFNANKVQIQSRDKVTRFT